MDLPYRGWNERYEIINTLFRLPTRVTLRNEVFTDLRDQI